MPDPSLGKLELVTLLAVARLAPEAYGLAVQRDLAARTGRAYAVGAVHTTLQRLEDKGFVTSHMTAPLPVRGGRSRRHFAITAAGQRAIADAHRAASAVWAGVAPPFGPLGGPARPEPA